MDRFPPDPVARAGSVGGRWSGRLVLGRGLVAFVGPGAAASAHRHDAIQFAWCREREIQVTTDAGLIAANAVLIASRQLHDFDAGGAPVVVVLLEPAGPLGREIGALARDWEGRDLLGRLDGIDFPSATDPSALVGSARQLLRALAGEASLVRGRVPRPEVLDAQRVIDSALSGIPRLEVAARSVGLSSRQLRRSFVEEVGVPFRRYVLWRRLRRALLGVRDGMDLTSAAAEAGFADAAHFSRTFKQSFGLSPSEVLPFIEVAEDDFPGP